MIAVLLIGGSAWMVVWGVPALHPLEDVPSYKEEIVQVQAVNGRTQAIATTRAAVVAARPV